MADDDEAFQLGGDAVVAAGAPVVADAVIDDQVAAFDSILVP